MKTIMQCNFLLLKLNIPNENIFLFFQKLKRSESTKEENNAYFDTSLETVPNVMSLGIATRMLQLSRLPTLIINMGFVQT